jgi:transcription-repair coupling factor (superfamily II helicase)
MLKESLSADKVLQWKDELSQVSSLLVEELWDSPKALLIALAQQTCKKHVLVLTASGKEDGLIFHDLPFFTGEEPVEFPAWETLPTENVAPSPDIVGERYTVLREISKSDKPRIILSSLHACLQKLIPPAQFSQLHIELAVNLPYAFNKLLEQLETMGYTRRPLASDKGEFAVRGGLIDIFPVNSPDPLRIEFWGDEISSIRNYDPVGQKSVGELEKIEITPAQEMELLEGQKDELVTLLDYLGPNTIIVYDDLLRLEDRYSTLVSAAARPCSSFCTIDEFLSAAQDLQSIYFAQDKIENLSEIKILDSASSNFYSSKGRSLSIQFEVFGKSFTARRWISPFSTISERLLGEWVKPDDRTTELVLNAFKDLPPETQIHFLTRSSAEKDKLLEQLKYYGFTVPEGTVFTEAYLSSGFCIENTVFFPYTEISHRQKIRRQKQRSTYHTTPVEIYDINPGDSVVHLNHGIGHYHGLKRQKNHMGVEGEYFHIEYAEKAQMFIPIDQAHHINKYVGSGEAKPRLHVLGSKRWKRAKETSEKAVIGYASELLELYANRSIKSGFAYPEDSEDMKIFEEEFPYIETEDQSRAIIDLKADLKEEAPMDRLICGDVGYGKTEVAMRAAFKAVMDAGKQVAVLVPTTVLAVQHYENFAERMSNFPISVAVLSRFNTAKKTREVLEQIATGTVDIVVGTHRLVSKDICFKNLGMVIIDEEQRFGVKAKEHLKTLRNTVDCLTLSATPIPRTLYMSLIGVRNTSIISTPPQDRLPIKTIIAQAEDALIKSALLRELTRDGQAFVIHNRVETIFQYASKIKKLLPQARISVVHGQMNSKEIDTAFHAFKSGQSNILVATSIIENGIDIPNANTIIIDRADRFGVADLYQIRGRVGRWNRRAYAYFLTPPKRILSELAQKRLHALANASGYGGGLKVAMHDLELRGAGDILGMEQSGHISSIGFHLYCKLLKRTINKLKGRGPKVFEDCKVDTPFDARLPEDYVNETVLRMEVYQRLGESMSWEEVDDLWNEIKDRFGSPPEEALWLYHLTRVRVFAASHGVTGITLKKQILEISIKKKGEISSQKIPFGTPKNPKTFEKDALSVLKKIC